MRAETDAPLRIDGNEGWTLETARELLPALVELGVELVEQPFPAADLDSFRALRELEPRLPVVIDEGCHDLARRGRGGRATPTGSTSSWPSPAGCARRCG